MILEQYGVNQSTIEDVQQILADSGNSVAAGNGSAPDLRQQLGDAGLNSTEIYSLLGPITGSNASQSVLPSGTVALSPIAQLSEELAWLQGDFREFDEAVRVYDEIVAIPEARGTQCRLSDKFPMMMRSHPCFHSHFLPFSSSCHCSFAGKHPYRWMGRWELNGARADHSPLSESVRLRFDCQLGARIPSSSRHWN